MTVILPPASSCFGRETGAQLFEFGDVSFIVLGDVGNRGPRLPQMLGGFAAHAANGNALDLSPLGEIRQFRLRELSAARRLRGGGSCKRAATSNGL